jgi:predicted nucleic acid-binding protein
MNIVVDASAAFEFLLRTSIGLRIEGIVAEADLFAPELLDVEVMSALRRHVRRGYLDDKRAAEALDDLFAWDVERVSNRELVRQAWDLRDNVTAYDAVYLAAARRHKASVITSDGPLARIPVSTGVIVHDVTRK